MPTGPRQHPEKTIPTFALADGAASIAPWRASEGRQWKTMPDAAKVRQCADKSSRGVPLLQTYYQPPQPTNRVEFEEGVA